MSDEHAPLFRELTLAFDEELEKPVVQTELQDWLDGKRDDGYRLIIAQRLARKAMGIFEKPD